MLLMCVSDKFHYLCGKLGAGLFWVAYRKSLRVSLSLKSALLPSEQQLIFLPKPHSSSSFSFFSPNPDVTHALLVSRPL